MKTIIVATDFSAEAENALEYAAEAARNLNAKVILFNSFMLPTHYANTLFPSSALDEIKTLNIASLKERADKINTKYGVETLCLTSFLNMEEELENIIKQHEADMIVMGTAQKSVMQDIFGNTTTTAIAKLKVPVLAIPMHAKYKGIKKILFACDILRGVHSYILDRIKIFAEKMGAEIEIFHVHKQTGLIEDSYTKKKIDVKLKNIHHSYKEVESNTVIKEIENEIKEIGADLLIMVPYQYGFWSSIVHASKTRIMASNSEVPLLSIPVIK
ncbi:universal stress protein [Pseudopedobacter beijingensis]|uniref:Universal stress protein n=1 Tax=Pseudopedobacter beijingensis TaxID=1207056 RepID=A0ABW4I6V8_9SPHI